jgi:RNA polymerase sigma-70 factor (ECF subfamily)
VRDGTPASDDRARFESDAIPYMRQMFPAAYRLTHDKCDAEDLLQETFARAFVKFHQYTPGTNLRAWLYCIMFRTFYSTCRKRSSKPAEVLTADLYQAGPLGADGHAALVPPSRSAESEALEILGDSPVMRALAQLPPQFKAALYLHDIHGYQQGDIAHIMGTPVGTVMSRIHRGRAMLRAQLRPASAAPDGLVRPRQPEELDGPVVAPLPGKAVPRDEAVRSAEVAAPLPGDSLPIAA